MFPDMFQLAIIGFPIMFIAFLMSFGISDMIKEFKHDKKQKEKSVSHD